MTWDTVQQFVRIALGWFAAFLVTKGYADQANAEIFTGGLMGVAQFAWWFIWNHARKA